MSKNICESSSLFPIVRKREAEFKPRSILHFDWGNESSGRLEIATTEDKIVDIHNAVLKYRRLNLRELS